MLKKFTCLLFPLGRLFSPLHFQSFLYSGLCPLWTWCSLKADLRRLLVLCLLGASWDSLPSRLAAEGWRLAAADRAAVCSPSMETGPLSPPASARPRDGGVSVRARVLRESLSCARCSLGGSEMGVVFAPTLWTGLFQRRTVRGTFKTLRT